jgi:hypothetical protein
VAAAIAAGVAVAQLAGDDGDGDADAPRRSTTVPLGGTADTNRPSPTRTAAAAPSDGEVFTDPQGTYTITLGPDWTKLPSAMVAEVETWGVADAAGGFSPNVNVLTQDAPGMDPDEYMRVSLAGLESIDGELLDHAFVVGPTGASLGLIEYTAQFSGSPVDLHFLAVFDLRDGTAIVGTFTATPDRFDELWPAVEPYLLTLRALG